MMRNFVKLLFVSILFFSCKKEEIVIPEPIINNVILHYNINQSVVGNVNETFEIDYDEDGIIDFYLKGIEVEDLLCGTGLDSNFTGNNSSSYYLHGISLNDQFLIGEIANIESNVAENVYWSNNGYTFHLNVYPKELTEKYFGFKKIIDDQVYYGWLKLQTDYTNTELVEVAINSLPNYDILVGQIE